MLTPIIFIELMWFMIGTLLRTILLEDTRTYKEDHLYRYARKNGRLRYSYSPQSPTKNDTQSQSEYVGELYNFNRARDYIDGMYVNSPIHMWLIKQMVKSNKWRFVTDNDDTILTSIYLIFADGFRLGEYQHFLCQIDRKKSLQETYEEFKVGRQDLKDWGSFHGHNKASLRTLAYLRLLDILKTHQVHEDVYDGTRSYRKWTKKPLEHP